MGVQKFHVDILCWCFILIQLSNAACVQDLSNLDTVQEIISGNPNERPYKLECTDGSDSVYYWQFCDGRKDCQNGEDENVEVCNEIPCERGYTKCSSGIQCFPDYTSCDTNLYCDDRSDDDPNRCRASVHVNITENMRVREISESVKEILNTEEEYTICDSKGIELTDSQETRALEFWKTPNRKVHAVKCSDLQLPRLHKTKRKRSNAMRDDVDNENRPTKMEDLLETLETNMKLEAQNMKDTLKDAIGDNAEEIMTSLNQVKTSLSNVNTKLEALDERVVDVKIETYVTSALRDILRCKVCTQVPRNTVIVAACCAQVLGCGECVQKCISENEFCILCKNPSVLDKSVLLKGFQMVLDKFQSV